MREIISGKKEKKTEVDFSSWIPNRGQAFSNTGDQINKIGKLHFELNLRDQRLKKLNDEKSSVTRVLEHKKLTYEKVIESKNQIIENLLGKLCTYVERRVSLEELEADKNGKPLTESSERVDELNNPDEIRRPVARLSQAPQAETFQQVERLESHSSWQAGLVLVFYCLKEGTQRQRDRILHLLYYLQDSTVSLVEPWQGAVLVPRHAAPSIGFSRLTETNLCWSGLQVEMNKS